MNTVAFKMLVGRQRQQQGAVPVLVSSWSARMHLRGPRVPDEESEVVGSLLCALANAPEGGVVLLGAVHEGAAGHITGVEDLGAAETCLIWLCDQMVPPLDPECWVDEAGGTTSALPPRRACHEGWRCMVLSSGSGAAAVSPGRRGHRGCLAMEAGSEAGPELQGVASARSAAPGREP